MASKGLRSKFLNLLIEITGLPKSANFNSHEEVITKMTGFSRGNLYETFSKNDNSQKSISRAHLKKIYDNLKDYCDTNSEAEFNFTLVEFMTKFSWASTIFNTNQTYTKKLPQVDRNITLAKKIFESDYLPIMLDLVHGSHKSLMIADFLGKGDNELGETQSIYGDVHDLIFAAIEDKLGINSRLYFKRKTSSFSSSIAINEPFTEGQYLLKYKRVFFLPHIDSQVIVNSSIAANDISTAIISGALICMSRAAFTHLCICLQSNNKSANFFAHPLIRPYHYGVAVGKKDADSVVFSEYYAYTRKRSNKKNKYVAEADLLFVENVSSVNDTSAILESYLEDFFTVDQNPHKIDRKLVEHFIKYAFRIKELYIRNMNFEDSDRFTNLFNVKIDVFNSIFGKNYPLVEVLEDSFLTNYPKDDS